MGDNVIGAIPAFAEYLSEQTAQGLPPASAASSNSVYFDLCGLWMISYSASTAKWLHSSVLPLVLLFPPPGVDRLAMGKVAGVCLLSMLSCLALPAAVGGLRAFLSGQHLAAEPWLTMVHVSAGQVRHACPLLIMVTNAAKAAACLGLCIQKGFADIRGNGWQAGWPAVLHNVQEDHTCKYPYQTCHES